MPKVSKKATVHSSEAVRMREAIKGAKVVRRLFRQFFSSMAGRADLEAIEKMQTLYAEIRIIEHECEVRLLSELAKAKVMH